MDLRCVLVTSTHGYDDFDVLGHPVVKRACVPPGLANGEGFNLYCHDGRKIGAVWRGGLEASIAECTQVQSVDTDSGPSAEQVRALRAFASKAGRNWKAALRLAWETGADTTHEGGALLRQLRNQFGPEWLATYTLAPELPLANLHERILRHAEHRFIEQGYMYDGNVSPKELCQHIVGLGYEAAWDALSELEQQGLLVKRDCLAPMSFKLPIGKQVELIEAHDLRRGWEERGCGFYPNDEAIGVIPQIFREAARLEAEAERSPSPA